MADAPGKGKYTWPRRHSSHPLILAHQVRSKYCETTQRKAKDPRSVESISTAYECGELRAPCVKLTCLDFKEDLYKKLKAEKIRQNNTNISSSQRSIKQELPVTRSSQKRRRINIEASFDIDEDDS
jgi:hypothetical protein